MTLLATTTDFSEGVLTYNAPDSRAPSTPFAATMETAKRNWFNEFLSGASEELADSLGFQKKIPVSDAQTPNFAFTSSGVAKLTQSPLVMWGAIGLIAFLALRKR